MDVTQIFNESQFFFLIMLVLWLYFISCGQDKQGKSPRIFNLLQFFVAMPLSLHVFSIAWFNALPFGYVIGVVIIIASILLLSTNFWD